MDCFNGPAPNLKLQLREPLSKNPFRKAHDETRMHAPLTALALLILIAPGISRAADIGSTAETCAGLLKGHGNKQQISRGQLA
jgi:hypothetical protein